MTSQRTGYLGDSTDRSYAETLALFERFAARELHEVIAGLGLREGQTVLDAGCGTGALTALMAEQVTPGGCVVGVDLSSGHLKFANDMVLRNNFPITFIQSDLTQLPFVSPCFDLIWSSNAINHVREPLSALKAFAELLVPGGRIALGQSAFLPDMFFAWDARLENQVTRACYQYYRDKYGLDERDTANVRNLVGLVKQAGLKKVTARTILIERTAPLSQEDELYFSDGVFRAHWGERLRSYLSTEDWEALMRLCDPDSRDFCLRRPDFHHIQTYTVVVGSS